MKYILQLTFVFMTSFCWSQMDYDTALIDSEMKKDASAIIRDQFTEITLHDFNDMTVRYKEAITVFDKKGLDVLRPLVYYDQSTLVKKVSAVLFDKNGKEKEKFKKKEFLDVSASGGSLYSDDRMKVLNFTPTFYPFTLEFTYETRSSSTAFIKPWIPSPWYQVSTEQSKYVLFNLKEIPMIVRRFNIDSPNIKVVESPGVVSFNGTQMTATDYEAWGPSVTEFSPMAKLALQKFQLKKTPAEVSTWKEFGLWQREKLLKGRDKLPELTKFKVTQMLAGIKEPKEKVKAIYQYMQDKTRYVSVQVGIGGWQPSTAEEVDRLGYGDCKGLTNYTMALLKSQGIESYYTIVDSQSNGKDLDEDFVAMQGNHVMLSVPLEDETVFLECTNQRIPFNFLGTHTDNRKVLMITPEGGVMTRTHAYTADDNLARLTASVKLDKEFKLSGTVHRESYGLQYAKIYELEYRPSEEIRTFYKKYWGHHNSLKVSNVHLENEKDEVKFTERLDFQTDGYVSKAADRILLAPNLFTRIDEVPKKNSNRKLPLVVRRGFSFVDEIRLNLPEGYVMESNFDPFELTTEFGSYKISMTQDADGSYLYKREFTTNAGTFVKEKYNDYVDFVKKVVRKDKSKIVVVKG